MTDRRALLSVHLLALARFIVGLSKGTRSPLGWVLGPVLPTTGP